MLAQSYVVWLIRIQCQPQPTSTAAMVLRLTASTQVNSGYSVSSAGDVNGDGFDDIIIGALVPTQRSNYAGESCCLQAGDWCQPQPKTLNSNGFKINGTTQVTLQASRSAMVMSMAMALMTLLLGFYCQPQRSRC